MTHILITICFRTFLALLYLFIITKILTKRSLSQLTYFDYLAVAMLGTLAGNLAFNIKIDTIIFIISMTMVAVIVYILSYLSIKSKNLRGYLAGKPTILIQDGKILEMNMYKLKYSFDYLIQQLRQQQIFNIKNVQSAILETNGELSVQLKSQNRPLTPKDMNIHTNQEGLAKEIIIDGKLIEKNLKSINLNKHWIDKELKKKNINNIKDISFGVISSNGELYIDLYRD